MPEHPRRPATAATVRAAAALARSKHCTLKTAKRGESRNYHFGAEYLTPLITGLYRKKAQNSQMPSAGHLGGRWAPAARMRARTGHTRHAPHAGKGSIGCCLHGRSDITAALSHHAVCSDLRSSSPARGGWNDRVRLEQGILLKQLLVCK